MEGENDGQEARERHPITLRKVFRAASGLSAASVLGIALSIPTSFLVAKWLGPEDFGAAQFVVLAYSYATLARLGVFEAGARAFIDRSGRGECSDATNAQNVGITFDTIFALLPGLLLLCAVPFLDDPLRRLGFVLAPVATVVASLSSFLSQLHTARLRFALVTRVNLLRAVLLPGLLLGGVTLFGAAAVFIAPVVVDLAVVTVFGLVRAPLDLRLVFDRIAALPLLRAGFPLGLGVLVYWAYRLVGSTAVAAFGSLAMFGIYTFAVAPVTLVVRGLTPVQAVLTPLLWGEMSVAEGGTEMWVGDARRLTLALAGVAGVATGIAQALFEPIVLTMVPAFADAIPIFEVLSATIYLLVIGLVPSLILDSARVNKQGLHLGIWSAGLAVNAAANILVFSLGVGVMAIAWNDVWVQFLVVMLIYEAAAPHFIQGRSRFRLYRQLLGVFGLMAIVTLILRLLPPPSTSTLATVLPQLALRSGTVLLIWAGGGAGWWLLTRFRMRPSARPARF